MLIPFFSRIESTHPESHPFTAIMGYYLINFIKSSLSAAVAPMHIDTTLSEFSTISEHVTLVIRPLGLIPLHAANATSLCFDFSLNHLFRGFCFYLFIYLNSWIYLMHL
jgi:hypothetical protein